MTPPTLLIAGAGPTLGAALARRFGEAGYRIALLSRNRATTDPIVTSLAAAEIEAAAFSADLTDENQTRAAIAEVRTRFGRIDVLEYSPIVRIEDMMPIGVTRMTAATLQSLMPLLAYGAISCVNAVLEDMMERGDGTILITTAGSASLPVPSHAALGAAFAAVRQYALALHAATSATGVFVGTVSLTVDLRPGAPVGDPARVADRYYRMHRGRGEAELAIVDPALMTALEARLGRIQAEVASTR